MRKNGIWTFSILASVMTTLCGGKPLLKFSRSKFLRRTLPAFLVGVVLAFGIFFVSVNLMLNAPRYTGPVTDHFDGKKFHYPGRAPIEKSMGELLKWRFSGTRAIWKGQELSQDHPVPPERVSNGLLRVTFVNHSTTLVQMDGLNILIDPIWSRRASPVTFAGPARFRPPGIDFEELPPIDVVFVSHNHYDHLDIDTLRRLAKEHSPRIIIPLGNSALLQKEGINGSEDLDWWQSVVINSDVKFTLTPALHWSARGLGDRNANLWGGIAIIGPSGFVFYPGDTGFADFYEQVREKFGKPRLAIIPVGAYEPQWFMSLSHQNPTEAVKAHQVLGAQVSLAVHWGTFALADDGMDQPVEELRTALGAASLTENDFWIFENGEGRDVP